MGTKRYSEEFKVEAAKQVTLHGRSAREVAERLGISLDSVYAWVRRYPKDPAARQATADEQAELKRVKAELKRVTEERDILKKAAAYFAKGSG